MLIQPSDLWKSEEEIDENAFWCLSFVERTFHQLSRQVATSYKSRVSVTDTAHSTRKAPPQHHFRCWTIVTTLSVPPPPPAPINIMCRYDLPVCPHPHQEDVVNLIYNPNKQAKWQDCDLPRPWGRLSCGNLTIAHPSFGVVRKCIWCTLALYASISKFKTTKENFKAELKSTEEATAGDAVLSGLDEKIAEKEAELDEFRKAAWEKRNSLLEK